MFDLSAHPLRCVTNVGEDLDDERTLDLGASSYDEASLEFVDDQRESDFWSTPQPIMPTKHTDAAEEGAFDSIDLWDEDTAGYESSASDSFFCDDTYSSQSTVLDSLGLDEEEVCWLSPSPITVLEETRPGSPEHSLEVDDEVRVRLSHAGFLRTVC